MSFTLSLFCVPHSTSFVFSFSFPHSMESLQQYIISRYFIILCSFSCTAFVPFRQPNKLTRQTETFNLFVIKLVSLL